MNIKQFERLAGGDPIGIDVLDEFVPDKDPRIRARKRICMYLARMKKPLTKDEIGQACFDMHMQISIPRVMSVLTNASNIILEAISLKKLDQFRAIIKQVIYTRQREQKGEIR